MLPLTFAFVPSLIVPEVRLYEAVFVSPFLLYWMLFEFESISPIEPFIFEELNSETSEKSAFEPIEFTTTFAAMPAIPPAAETIELSIPIVEFARTSKLFALIWPFSFVNNSAITALFITFTLTPAPNAPAAREIKPNLLFIKISSSDETRIEPVEFIVLSFELI